MIEEKEIAILDFGSQYTHLIARRIRELGVMSHIYPTNTPARKLKHAGGIILSGGPRSVVREATLPFDTEIFSLSVPILGLCYGHQLMAKTLGGSVASGAAREYGMATIRHTDSPIFSHVKPATTVWMSHGDHVEKLPKGFAQIATTGNRSIAAMADEKNKRYGFQFHPEVAHSREGRAMLSNFLFHICCLQKNWTTSRMMTDIEAHIAAEALGKKVFLLVSGGVDSTVCFALLQKVLGKNRVYGLYVDTGFMRKDETKNIRTALARIGLNRLHVYRAEKEFLHALEGVVDPEQKRHIIGNLFLDITDRIMTEKGMTGKDWLVGQGTIYPDTIESGGTKHADKIKTHHNRVPRIQQMIADGRIIEPLKELYKDEVRELGARLRLPKQLIFRHPFPGPGLAIRCLCSGGDATVPIRVAWKPTSFWQLPVRSVGVQGDERSYAHPALIPKRFVRRAPQLTNTYKECNRVLSLVAGNVREIPQARVSPAHLTKKRLELLRTVDNIVHREVANHPIAKHIWQMPVVLLPFGTVHKESVVIRPVQSEEAMTVAWAKIPDAVLKKMAKKIMALGAIDFIFFDLTNKPPGTIEWE